MQTLELLQKLYHALSSHPDTATSIDWNDVSLCILQEFELRPRLYDDRQKNSLGERVSQLTADISSSARYNDLFTIKTALAELIGIARALPDPDHYDAENCEHCFNRAALRHYREDTTIVVGDSHVNFFSGNEDLNYLPLGNGINLCPSVGSSPFTVLYIGSSLAYTCNEPDSTSGFRRKFQYLTETFIHPGARILFSLGEIDLRAHVMAQTEKQKRSYKEIINDILDRYLAFLREIRRAGYSVYCWGPIASQKDSAPETPAFPRVGTEKERNMATAYFNEQLENLCKKEEIPMFSIFSGMITEDYQTLGEYLSADHVHLSQRAMILAEPLLRSAGLLP